MLIDIVKLGTHHPNLINYDIIQISLTSIPTLFYELYILTHIVQVNNQKFNNNPQFHIHHGNGNHNLQNRKHKIQSVK